MAEEIYLIMNKPCGYVCSAVSDSHRTVYELLPESLRALVRGAKRGHRLHTIGRLDCDTGGLLLLTTDGKFSHNIAAKSSAETDSAVFSGPPAISKTYRVTLTQPVSPEEQKDYISRAAKGLTLPPEKKFGKQECEPAKLTFLTNTLCEITIHEGKFHEVRRIFRALNNEVKDLMRTSIGGLGLPEELLPGDWREMTALEKSRLAVFKR